MLKKLIRFMFNFILLALLVCCENIPDRDTGSQPISHERWDALLAKHVTDDGMVNYESFLADSIQLNKYLSTISNNYPNEQSWSREERLAYWINAYNAFTVQLILRHYPLKSIKDIKSAIAIPFINSVWDIKFIKIEGKKYDLNNIEHGILRKKFNEPRIHFAINCASISCPLLRNEAFIASKLETQLQEQAILFVNDPIRNKIDANRIEVSKIFSWFAGDFKKEGTLIEFLNMYSKTPIDTNAKTSFMDYDWRLNHTNAR